MRVSLREFVDALETRSDEVEFFLNTKSGEILSVTSEDRLLVDAYEEDDTPADLVGWQREALEQSRAILDSPDWVKLPDGGEINDWMIMEAFCIAQEADARDELLNAINGRGAFRMFRDVIHRRGLRDAWFAARRGKLEQIAREWLQARDLPFE